VNFANTFDIVELIKNLYLELWHAIVQLIHDVADCSIYCESFLAISCMSFIGFYKTIPKLEFYTHTYQFLLIVKIKI
jgi:ABC-type enterochelin transport system ATPase subunit